MSNDYWMRSVSLTIDYSDAPPCWTFTDNFICFEIFTLYFWSIFFELFIDQQPNAKYGNCCYQTVLVVYGDTRNENTNIASITGTTNHNFDILNFPAAAHIHSHNQQQSKCISFDCEFRLRRTYPKLLEHKSVFVW